jgi:hypothetical protein
MAPFRCLAESLGEKLRACGRITGDKNKAAADRLSGYDPVCERQVIRFSLGCSENI